MHAAAQELKAKKLEMARLQIALQGAENRRNQALLAAEARARKAAEAREFAAMKARMAQLERLVAAAAAAGAALPPRAVRCAALTRDRACPKLESMLFSCLFLVHGHAARAVWHAHCMKLTSWRREGCRASLRKDHSWKLCGLE